MMRTSYLLAIILFIASLVLGAIMGITYISRGGQLLADSSFKPLIIVLVICFVLAIILILIGVISEDVEERNKWRDKWG